jgi:serine/threonine protein kinase
MAQATSNDPPEAIGSQSCPSDAELRAVAEGSLPDPELDSILRHLAECDRCEASLAGFAEEQTRAEEYRLPAAAESVVCEPECLRMQGAIRNLAERIASAHAQPNQESTDKTRLSTDNGRPKRLAAAIDATTTFVPTIPRKIGRYEVRSLLGEGAYGQVFLAHDPRLDRQVALKVAKYGPTVSRALIDAFLREAKVAARFKHPGIVAVYDADVDEGAGCYIVMEYVEGKSLKQVIAEGNVSHEKAADYIAQAAEALAYAHKRDLVHRDIKPANLLLDKDGKIKVADFGLAIFEEEQRKQAGEFAGTLAYCSPEQIRGEVHHFDGRTDIWSLGVVFYELLAGRRPFRDPNISDEILHRSPKPPRQIDDRISAELERICQKCLAKEANCRFSTGKDLAQDLNAIGRAVPRTIFQVSFWGVSISIITAAVLLVASIGIYVPQSEIKPGGSMPPTIPYHVDAVAEPGAWLRLLTQEPRTLFPRDPQAGLCPFSAKEESILMNNSGVYLVGLGTTDQRSFELQVDVTKHAREGAFGFFLGYKPSSEHPNASITQLVLVNYDGPEECTVQREVVRVIETPDGSVGTRDRSMFAWSLVQPLRADGIRLEVTVKGGEIDRIAWRGEEFPKLRGKQTPEFMHYTDCVGEFGLINFSGTTTFQSPRFRLHSRSTP